MIWLLVFYAFLFSGYCFAVAYIYSDYATQKFLKQYRAEVKNEKQDK